MRFLHLFAEGRVVLYVGDRAIAGVQQKEFAGLMATAAPRCVWAILRGVKDNIVYQFTGEAVPAFYAMGASKERFCQALAPKEEEAALERACNGINGLPSFSVTSFPFVIIIIPARNKPDEMKTGIGGLNNTDNLYRNTGLINCALAISVRAETSKSAWRIRSLRTLCAFAPTSARPPLRRAGFPQPLARTLRPLPAVWQIPRAPCPRFALRGSAICSKRNGARERQCDEIRPHAKNRDTRNITGKTASSVAKL
jgi:hypothetical protein